jgi:hypothetical protein
VSLRETVGDLTLPAAYQSIRRREPAQAGARERRAADEASSGGVRSRQSKKRDEPIGRQGEPSHEGSPVNEPMGGSCDRI